MAQEQIMQDAVQHAIKSLDPAVFQQAVNEAVRDYLGSDEFQADVCEALSDQNVGWEVGEHLADQIRNQIDRFKITIG